MSVLIGKVVSTPWLDRVKNGQGQALFLQVKIGGGSDVRTAQYMPQSGEDTVPIKNSIVALVQAGGILLAVATYDGIASTRAPGEKELYSSDGTVKLARIALKQSGLLYLASQKNSKNLYDVLKSLADAVKTLAAGVCANGSVVTTSATAITAVNTMEADLALLLANIP